MKRRRIMITRRGGPEVLALVEDEAPEPGPGEARVRVRAAGVSFAEVLMREGLHPEYHRVPFTPGWDVVGVVDRLGPGVRDLAVGQSVLAMPIVGGYTDSICLPARELFAIPEETDPAQAVCLPLNYGTAYQMLHRTARARSWERALVHSAAGGVGTALLELGGLLGLETIGTASASKHDLVRRMGATPIDYRSEDFVARTRELVPGGVDIVFDGIGGPHLARSYRVLARGGRLVGYGFGSFIVDGRRSWGAVARGTAAWIAALARNLVPDGRRVRVYSIQTWKRLHPDWFREDLTALIDLLAASRIDPVVAERVPLAEAARAQELVTTGRTRGKVVLRCDA